MNSNFRFLDLCLILTVCTILAILTTGYSTQQAAARAKCMENLKIRLSNDRNYYTA